MMDTHPHLSLGEGDTVIFSSKTIPGNEESVHRLIEGLKDRGVSVIHADDAATTLHASGHPCQDELKDLYETLKPRLTFPSTVKSVTWRPTPLSPGKAVSP